MSLHPPASFRFPMKSLVGHQNTALSPSSAYECAHDWVSQGHPKPDGIIKYYEAYYNDYTPGD